VERVQRETLNGGRSFVGPLGAGAKGRVERVAEDDGVPTAQSHFASLRCTKTLQEDHSLALGDASSHARESLSAVLAG